jgi:hypothetical protein
MDLFAKKAPKASPKPIEVVPATPRAIEESARKFDEEKELEVNLKKAEKSIAPRAIVQPQIIAKNESRAKYDKFVPVTTRISEDEYMGLKRVENQIMRNRSKANPENRERITFNSVMRCLVANFLERSDDINLSEIQNEEILNERIKEMFN